MDELSIQSALLKLRRLRGKTQSEFADEIGISTDYYGRIERGSIKANLRLILDIERKFDVCLLPRLDTNINLKTETELLIKIWETINLFPKKNLKFVLNLLINALCLSDDSFEAGLSLNGDTSPLSKELQTRADKQDSNI